MPEAVMTKEARGSIDGFTIRTFKPGDAVPPALYDAFVNHMGVAHPVADQADQADRHKRIKNQLDLLGVRYSKNAGLKTLEKLLSEATAE